MSFLKKSKKSMKFVGVGLLMLVMTTSLVYAASGVFNDNCNSNAACRQSNNTTGIGTYGISSSSANGAVRGFTSGTSAVGVYGRGSNNIGVRGQGGTGGGDYGGYFQGFEGVRGIASGSNGYGIWGHANGSSGRGGYGYANGTNGYGLYGYSSQYLGVRGYSAGTQSTDYGGYFSAARRGLYANGSSGWFDAYFPNCVYIGGSSYGTCLTSETERLSVGMTMQAVNNGSETLVPGDVVVFAGVSSVEGLSTPVLLVQKASGAADEAVIGVVQSAYILETLTPESAVETKAKSDTILPTEAVAGEEAVNLTAVEAAVENVISDDPDHGGHAVVGNVAPGSLSLVQVQGIAQVNVDASKTAITAGDSLVASQTGLAVTASRRVNLGADNGLVVGRALESMDNGSGAIYVLLGAR